MSRQMTILSLSLIVAPSLVASKSKEYVTATDGNFKHRQSKLQMELAISLAEGRSSYLSSQPSTQGTCFTKPCRTTPWRVVSTERTQSLMTRQKKRLASAIWRASRWRAGNNLVVMASTLPSSRAVDVLHSKTKECSKKTTSNLNIWSRLQS